MSSCRDRASRDECWSDEEQEIEEREGRRATTLCCIDPVPVCVCSAEVLQSVETEQSDDLSSLPAGVSFY